MRSDLDDALRASLVEIEEKTRNIWRAASLQQRAVSLQQRAVSLQQKKEARRLRNQCRLLIGNLALLVVQHKDKLASYDIRWIVYAVGQAARAYVEVRKETAELMVDLARLLPERLNNCSAFYLQEIANTVSGLGSLHGTLEVVVPHALVQALLDKFIVGLTNYEVVQRNINYCEGFPSFAKKIERAVNGLMYGARRLLPLPIVNGRDDLLFVTANGVNKETFKQFLQDMECQTGKMRDKFAEANAQNTVAQPPQAVAVAQQPQAVAAPKKRHNPYVFFPAADPEAHGLEDTDAKYQKARVKTSA